MEQLQNRPLAILLCVVMIVAASLLGAHMSLSALRTEVEAIYADEGNGAGIATDIADIAEECRNLRTIATQNGLGDSAAVQQMMQTHDKLQAATSVREQYQLVQDLGFEAQMVTELLSAQGLDPQALSLMETRMANINARLTTMSRSPYNEAAAAFNQTRGQFPANILSMLTGIRPLELFA